MYKLWIAITLVVATGMTYATEGLWGSVDEPIEDVLQMPDTMPIDTPMSKAPLTPQKTTCEVLRTKPELGEDLYAAQLQDGLKYMRSTIRPEYRMLFADNKSIDELYKQYRDQYLKVNCAKQ